MRTTLNESEIKKINLLNKKIVVAKTSKSYSLRLLVPKIDRLKDFYIQIDDLIICFEKIKLFEEIKYEILKVCNVA